MKKLLTIGFLLLLLFNLVGYRFWFDYIQQESNLQLQATLEKGDYKEQDLLTLRIPLSLPYQTDQADFERVEGEITLNGKIYTYVKRKVSGGELILMCLPDKGQMQLESARVEFFKLANDLVQSNHSSKSNSSKSHTDLVFPVYDYTTQSSRWHLDGFTPLTNSSYTLYRFQLPSRTLSVAEKPPQAMPA